MEWGRKVNLVFHRLTFGRSTPVRDTPLAPNIFLLYSDHLNWILDKQCYSYQMKGLNHIHILYINKSTRVVYYKHKAHCRPFLLFWPFRTVMLIVRFFTRERTVGDWAEQVNLPPSCSLTFSNFSLLEAKSQSSPLIEKKRQGRSYWKVKSKAGTPWESWCKIEKPEFLILKKGSMQDGEFPLLYTF